MSESFHFFGAIIWYQAFSEMFAEFFLFPSEEMIPLKWFTMTGHFWYAIQEKRHGFFFQKTYFFEVETTNHYFFCSILSDNEPMCGFFKKKKKCSKIIRREERFLKKQIELEKKSRTLSKHLVIAMSSSKWADSVLKLQNKDIMIIFRLFPGYFLLIDYLCTYTIPPISSQLKLKITISFILVLPWICTIIA